MDLQEQLCRLLRGTRARTHISPLVCKNSWQAFRKYCWKLRMTKSTGWKISSGTQACNEPSPAAAASSLTCMAARPTCIFSLRCCTRVVNSVLATNRALSRRSSSDGRTVTSVTGLSLVSQTCKAKVSHSAARRRLLLLRWKVSASVSLSHLQKKEEQKTSRSKTVQQCHALIYCLSDVGSGRAFCSEIGSFCLKNKSGIFVNGIIYDNETKERTFLFLLVLMWIPLIH